MGSRARRKAARRRARSGPGQAGHAGSIDRLDESNERAGGPSGLDADLAMARAAMWNPEPGAFLNVVSSFVGFGESSGLPVPPMHVKLADMGVEATDLDHALLVALAHIAPVADDRIHAGSLVAAMSRHDRDRLPSWLGELGQVSATTAARLVDDECSRDLWLVEVRIGDYPLTALVGIDNEFGVPAEVANTSPMSLESLVSAAVHPAVGDGLSVEVTPAEAGERIIAALDLADERLVAPKVPFWPDPSALLRWVASVAIRS